MAPSTIYLDHNATSPLDPAVAEAMAACRERGHANPASQHGPGRTARRVLERCRERVAELLGANTAGLRPDAVVFTSGGTEANSLGVRGLALASGGPPGRIVVSAIEHPSVAETADQLAAEGWRVDRLPVDRDGVARLDELERLLSPTPRPALVSLMLGNNETGVLQPVHEAAALCDALGVPLHTDAVQVVGKAPIGFRELRATSLTLTAHKFHGPMGIGALVLRAGTTLAPQLRGGRQQGGVRPGTEGVELAVGLATALEIAFADAGRMRRLRDLRDRFEGSLRHRLSNIEVVGEGVARLPHTSCVAFVGLDRQAILMALDLAGVACSTGSACASGSSEPSPVLVAMRLDERVYGAALRFSLGATTTTAEIDGAVDRISRVVNTLRAGAGG
ncbi:MAG: cysteine desulfurase family protein [Lacipirellulaceae bacterium]